MTTRSVRDGVLALVVLAGCSSSSSTGPGGARSAPVSATPPAPGVPVPAPLPAPAPAAAARPTKTKLFARHWLQASEEQGDGETQIFRPEGHSFRPSRFRMQYVFREDGSCDWYVLSPSDDHHFAAGRWSWLPGDALTLELHKGEAVERYRVDELSQDVLRITLIAAP